MIIVIKKEFLIKETLLICFKQIVISIVRQYILYTHYNKVQI